MQAQCESPPAGWESACDSRPSHFCPFLHLLHPQGPETLHHCLHPPCKAKTAGNLTPSTMNVHPGPFNAHQELNHVLTQTPVYQNLVIWPPESKPLFCIDGFPYLANCPTRWSLLLLIGYWCRSSSWWWQPHIRGCRLHYPLPRAEMRFLVQFFSKMYLLYVSIWWKNWKPHFFAIFNPSKTQFSWTLWDHLATFPDLRFHLAGTSNPEK